MTVWHNKYSLNGLINTNKVKSSSYLLLISINITIFASNKNISYIS